MSRSRRLSHTIRHCQYHIVWVPKYACRPSVSVLQRGEELSSKHLGEH